MPPPSAAVPASAAVSAPGQAAAAQAAGALPVAAAAAYAESTDVKMHTCSKECVTKNIDVTYGDNSSYKGFVDTSRARKSVAPHSTDQIQRMQLHNGKLTCHLLPFTVPFAPAMCVLSLARSTVRVRM
jgi:hypothetical protein